MVNKKVGVFVFFLCLILTVAALVLFFQNVESQPTTDMLFTGARSRIQEAVENPWYPLSGSSFSSRQRTPPGCSIWFKLT